MTLYGRARADGERTKSTQNGHPTRRASNGRFQI
jgi:hypothetical protein